MTDHNTTSTTRTSPAYTFRQSDVREDFARWRQPRPTSPPPTTKTNNQNDETIRQNQQQPDVATSKPLNGVLDDEDEDDFMMRIVHGSCQRYFFRDEETNDEYASGDIPTTGTHPRKNNNGKFCGPDIIPGCQATLEDHLDLFMHCRQPLSFLSFFHEHESVHDVGVEVLPAGAYIIARDCEYCGATDINDCTATCKRPKLYFQKMRPPFHKTDPTKWDPSTNHYIPPPTVNNNNNTNDPTTQARPMSPSSATGSWFPGLFQQHHQPQGQAT